MPGTKKLRPYVVQSVLLALGCFLSSVMNDFAQSPVTFIFAVLLLCYWLYLCGKSVYQFRWRGLWVLLGAPLAMARPYQIVHLLVRCYHSFCID